MDQVAQILTRAVEAVEKASVPDDLRAAALPEAIQLFARGVQAPIAAPPRSTGTSAEEPSTNATPSLDKLAQRLGIPLDVLSDVYVEVNGELQLGVPSRNIASSKKEGAAEIAVLVCVGRQGTGVDQDLTPNAEVRRWAQELNRYDEKHFGEHIQAADHLLTIVGKGQRRQMRVKWHEADQLKAVILKAAGRE
jgi:hypothetical protein